MASLVAWQRTLEEGLRQAAERRHRLLLLNTSALPQEALLEALWPALAPLLGVGSGKAMSLETPEAATLR